MARRDVAFREESKVAGDGVDLEGLRDFLNLVAREGYASREQERTWTKQPDGSTTIALSQGDWSLPDTFFGGEP